MEKLLFAVGVTCLVCGYSDKDESAAAFAEFIDHCDGPIKAELVISAWNRGLTLTCDDWIADFRISDE